MCCLLSYVNSLFLWYFISTRPETGSYTLKSFGRRRHTNTPQHHNTTSTSQVFSSPLPPSLIPPPPPPPIFNENKVSPLPDVHVSGATPPPPRMSVPPPSPPNKDKDSTSVQQSPFDVDVYMLQHGDSTDDVITDSRQNISTFKSAPIKPPRPDRKYKWVICD